MVFGVAVRAVEYNENDALRIHHLIRVHTFARIIGKSDGFDESNQKIAELAALLHDIGIHNAEKKYDSTDGKYQEIDRVCYIVEHHHTLSAIDGQDFQAVVEADLLVNMYDDHLDKETIRKIRDRIFKTRKGTQLVNEMYLSDKYTYSKSRYK